MTGPTHDEGLVSSRLGRARRLPPAAAAPQAPAGSDYEAAEIARGQSAAVLGALARMQLRIDVLAREQSDRFAQVMSLLEEINDKLGYQDEAPPSDSNPSAYDR